VQRQPGFNSTFDYNLIDPDLPHVNELFPEDHINLLPNNNNNNNAAQKDPATLDDDTFIKNLLEYSDTCDLPIADVFNFSPLPEEFDIHPTNGQSKSPASSPSGLDNIHAEVSADSVTQEETFNHVETEPMDIVTTRHLDADDYIVPQLETLSNNNLTPVCGVFNILVNTKGKNPLVVQVTPPPIPTPPLRSQTVIKQGPVLAERLLTTQAQCKQAMQTNVGSPKVKKVAKTNAERCALYRIRQKTKKKDGDEELRSLEDKNKALKAKEAALRNKVKRVKEAALRMGLGNYFNFDM